MTKILCIYTTRFSACIFSCNSAKDCSKNRNYFKPITDARAYEIKGIYCIAKVEFWEEEGSKVKLNIYDRVSGELVELGRVAYGNLGENTKIVEFSSGISNATLSAGKHDIEIMTVANLPFRIKSLKFKNNSYIEINCFLGDILQH
ncbi:MAG: hypothetical protein R3B93_16110 [Bacteroidia bacterium]